MTRLTYVFPFLTGILKVALPFLVTLSATSYSVSFYFWIATLLSLGFLIICAVYVIVQVIVWAIYKPGRTLSDLKHFLNSVKKRPSILFGLLNGVLGGATLVLIICGSGMTPRVSPGFLLVCFSSGQLLTAIILDLSGLLWVSRKYPHEESLAGASLLFLGIILLLMHPTSLSIIAPYVLRSLGFGFGAGICSVICHALTHRLSVDLKSYWGGTTMGAIIQTVVLVIISIIIDRNANDFSSAANSIFHSEKAIALSIGVICHFVIGSASIQFFGYSGGYFTTLGPVAAGQIIVSCFVGFNSHQDLGENVLNPVENIPLTAFVIAGLLSVFIGSIFVWIGRWGPKQEKYTIDTDLNSDGSPIDNRLSVTAAKMKLKQTLSYKLIVNKKKDWNVNINEPLDSNIVPKEKSFIENKTLTNSLLETSFVQQNTSLFVHPLTKDETDSNKQYEAINDRKSSINRNPSENLLLSPSAGRNQTQKEPSPQRDRIIKNTPSSSHSSFSYSVTNSPKSPTRIAALETVF